MGFEKGLSGSPVIDPQGQVFGVLGKATGDKKTGFLIEIGALPLIWPELKQMADTQQKEVDESILAPQFSPVGSVKLPLSDRVSWSSMVIDIVDRSEFQRLRHVKQLGPTTYIFPGGDHSRWQHSIGVYSLTRSYLDRLETLPAYLNIVGEGASRYRKTIEAAALLHDIGHYPFSHWIEEFADPSAGYIKLPNGIRLERHEGRAKHIIETPDETNQSIKTVLINSWGFTAADLELMYYFIGANKKTKPSPAERLVKSILDSYLDADKLDYLRRDSYHCDVPYGQSLDVTRFLNSLWVDTRNA